MEIERRNVLYIEKVLEKEAKIELIDNENNIKIKFFLNKTVIEKEAENYFEALIELRMELEKMNIKLLCKGCCKNVYPSGMLLSMGTGRKAYALTYGKPAKVDSLVDIFDSCSIEEYGTIDQQLEFFENWTNSLGR